MLDAILAYLLTPDSSPSRFSGADIVLRDLLDALQSSSLFGGEPIVVLDEFEKAGKKELQPLFEQTLTSGYLLLGSRSKTPYAAAIEKQGIILDLTEEKPWDKEKRISDQLVERVKNAGKQIEPDALHLFLERLDKDAALLASEMDKLLCFVGERDLIRRTDVVQISAASRSSTLWQVAEEAIWEGRSFSDLDSASFHGLLPILRSQLQLGWKIALLIEGRVPAEEWSSHLPKIWPKTLEKRSSAAARIGSEFFRKGLDKLFEIELLSRTQSTQTGALLDLFRTHWMQYVR